MTSLAEKFEKYVGRNIRDPRHTRPEDCRTMRSLELEANNMCRAVVFRNAGQPLASDEFLARIQRHQMSTLMVDVTDTGAHGWVIDGIEAG